MLDEQLLEQEASLAARAAVIARALADERHRTIAFLAAYLALQPRSVEVGPVIARLVGFRHAPDLAPTHLRRLAAIVHVACALVSGAPLSVPALAAAGCADELPRWRRIARRL